MRFFLRNGVFFLSSSLGLAFLIFYCLPLPAEAQDIHIKPGRYVMEGGWGHLSVKAGKSGGASFSITTIGSNAHTCSLDGEIRQGQATLKSFKKGNPCVVRFMPKGNDISVSVSGEECRYYCGARAYFDGLYLKPARGCEADVVRKTRNEFKRLYDKKAYAQARDKLQGIPVNCVKTINSMEMNWIRNDLALTQYKLNDFQGCLKTISHLEADAAKTDEEIRGEYPPSDADNYIRLISAVRTNLKLCREGARRSGQQVK